MEMLSQRRRACRFLRALAMVLTVCMAPFLCAQVPPGAMVVGAGVYVGGTLWVDSFDSADPAFSNGGRYDRSKFRANGDIRCASLLNIYGNTAINGRLP
jgi:hypothetical protein